jgi:protein TonB
MFRFAACYAVFIAVALSLPAPSIASGAARAQDRASKSHAARPVAKAPSKRMKQAKAARPLPVAFTPQDGFELIPPQTEQEALEALERDVSLKIGKQRKDDDYPEEAQRYGWSGTALIDVLVAANGSVKQVALGRSSGFRVLDEQALTMVRRVSRVFVPSRLRGREVSVSVPIGFMLQRI